MVAEDTGGLVGDALAGDQLALSRLVAALTPVVQARVARTLLARGASRGGGRNLRHDVEDLTQEIFLALFSGGGRVLRSWRAERGLSLENFVGLVSERHVVSFLRSGRRNPWREDLGVAEDLEARAGEAGPEEETASREQLRLLLDRLQRTLSPLGRQVFDLLFVQELTLPEAMAASGLSADAVYAWRSRLRRAARELLAELSGSAPAPRKTGEMPRDE
jgi:RNA polymerase sigma-70 factor (ECF subfamily)